MNSKKFNSVINILKNIISIYGISKNILYFVFPT